MHDYFNLRHAQLRSVVERAINLLKQRFRILTTAPEYELNVQVRIPAALCCIHNIIRRWDPEDMGGDQVKLSSPSPATTAIGADRSEGASPDAYGALARNEFAEGRDTMIEKREEIATRLWMDHLNRCSRTQDYDVEMK